MTLTTKKDEIDEDSSKKQIPWGLTSNVQRKILEERKEAVFQNPDLIVTTRWDLSDVFYKLRHDLDQMGYDTTPLMKRRHDLNNQVKEICEKHLGVKRHEIGIFAGDRAQLLFKGETYNVNMENIDVSLEYGTDIIVIENEGIIEKLKPFIGDGSGFAILQSSGFLTEYAIELARLAKRKGANIIILTDFDSSGIDITILVPTAQRLGIDFETLDDFGS